MAWLGTLLWALVVPTAGAQTGQPAPPGPAVGAMASWALTSARNVARGRTGSDFAVNLDVPLPWHVRVRGELGRSRFVFDGVEGLPAPRPPETLAFTRVTGAGLAVLDAGADIYGGIGYGWYHVSTHDVPATARSSTGLHLVIGTDIPVLRDALSLRLEAQWQFVNLPAPGGIAVHSRADVLGNPVGLVWGLGIGWRF